jgi:hypothetical protein
VVPFLKHAGEPFNPKTAGHLHWEPSGMRVKGKKVDALPLFDDNNGQPSPRMIQLAEDPPVTLVDAGPFSQYGDVFERDDAEYIQISENPTHWVCVRKGKEVYAVRVLGH